eukprot:TRINITY_DN71541_c0_g1_i1.p1 TRINITY_DN71541_c0_g1~~TRINITY_DN71541_c0_g1_i1.p1  ORF type:complete len:252 (+),score=27.09 TRINITY_DN71541_c0_g1_i1:180-935(+)
MALMENAMVAPPAQDNMMNVGVPDAARYAQWTAKDVANYFAVKGYPEYSNLWVKHKITGDRAVLLMPEDLEKMGICIVGDRLGIQKELRLLKGVARQEQRQAIVAHHQQAYDGPWCQEQLQTKCCFCLCPWEPDSYTLTRNALKLRSYTIERLCGAKCSCLGGTWKSDTITLERIVDVDTTVMIKGCGCCAERKCVIDVTTRAGTGADSEESRITQKSILLPMKLGEDFAQQIRQAMEESRTMHSVGVDIA